jgi:hypothetical protein
MKTYKHNSETWYCDIQPLVKQLRRWVVSIGGLETPYHTRDGYTYRWDKPVEKIRRSIRSHSGRHWLFGAYSTLCPLSLLGGRITFQPFGVSYYRRRIKGWYCLNYDIVNPGPKWSKHWKCYRSHNATPWGADRWYFGAPREIIKAATEHHNMKTLEREIREARDSEHAHA